MNIYCVYGGSNYIIIDDFIDDAENNLFNEQPPNDIGATVNMGVDNDDADISIQHNEHANTD